MSVQMQHILQKVVFPVNVQLLINIKFNVYAYTLPDQKKVATWV